MVFNTQKQELVKFRNEVTILRSFVIGIAGKDIEGDHNPTFVKHLLKTSQKEPEGITQNQESFFFYPSVDLIFT